jgi:hypothetical protein
MAFSVDPSSILRFLCPPIGEPRLSVFEKPLFPDAASGDYSLASTRTDHYGIDLQTIFHHDEVCGDGSTS